MVFPDSSEYPEFYAVYLGNIHDRDDIIKILSEGRDKTQSFIKSLSEERGNYSYAEGKWSIKEILGHIADVERIMAYRALCIARGELKSLPGFEQDDYVKSADFNGRSLESLAEELMHLRNSNISLFRSFNPESLMRRGIANNHEFTANAFLYIIAGHEIHHLKILKERYL